MSGHRRHEQQQRRVGRRAHRGRDRAAGQDRIDRMDGRQCSGSRVASRPDGSRWSKRRLLLS